jgi:hypothetical protein
MTGCKPAARPPVAAALDLIGTFSQGDFPPELIADYSPGSRRYATIWDQVVKSAEAHYDPGVFTTIIGFEWTSLVAGNNLHRNVLFRDGAARRGW